eukprot:14125323-Alexandrium_andersonii.AAC.1
MPKKLERNCSRGEKVIGESYAELGIPEGGIAVEIAGSFCKSWAAMGNQCRKASTNHVICITWAMTVRRTRPFVVLRERAGTFDPQ